MPRRKPPARCKASGLFRIVKTPLAVFAYRRPEHLGRTLAAMKRCARLEDCAVTIFCDGPRDAAAEPAVEAVRTVARAWAAVHGAEVRIQPENLGLARSIVAGVSELCAAAGRVIVLEDDLEPAPDFLAYMLTALDRYAETPEVLQVAGFVFPIGYRSARDAFFMPYTSTWGWATWARAWKNFRWELSPAEMQILHEPAERKAFDVAGSYPAFEMLQSQQAGRTDSWGILWWWAVFRARGLVLYPREALVKVGGCDGSGTHCDDDALGVAGRSVGCFPSEQAANFPETTVSDESACASFVRYLHSRAPRSRGILRARLAPMLSHLRSRLGSVLRRVVALIDDPAAEVARTVRRMATLHPTVRVHPTCSVHDPRNDPRNISVGANSHLRGQFILFWRSGEIRMGEWCYLGENSRLYSRSSIQIGNYVEIGHLVDIFDTNCHPLDWRERRRDFTCILGQGHDDPTVTVQDAPVVIEDDVIICCKVTILKGVRIGKGAFIGAGSVVTGDVPAHALVAGNPARVIRQLDA